MKRHLKRVPVYLQIGNIETAPADKAVTDGHAQSLRGRALLLFDRPHLIEILSKTNLDPETVALVLRAAARVEAERLAKDAARTSDPGVQ